MSLTIAGLNFGLTDPTPRERVSGSACESTAWIADSTIACKVAQGIEATKYLTVTIDQQIAWTVTELVSYDVPMVSIEDNNFITTFCKSETSFCFPVSS